MSDAPSRTGKRPTTDSSVVVHAAGVGHSDAVMHENIAMVESEATRVPAPAPPTILVVHPREKRSKCSIEPLRGRPGFVFWTFPDRGTEPLDRYVRIGLGGPPLSLADAGRGLLLLDGTWHLARRMEPQYASLPVRSLPPVRTAYPRSSKLFDDPHEGLATIEALYVAHHILGRDTDGLLDHYRWKQEFLERNWPPRPID